MVHVDDLIAAGAEQSCDPSRVVRAASGEIPPVTPLTDRITLC